MGSLYLHTRYADVRPIGKSAQVSLSCGVRTITCTPDEPVLGAQDV